MNIMPIAKGLASTAASLGVSTVVTNAIKATTPIEVSKYSKVLIGLGGIAVTALVGDAVTRRTEQKIDEFGEHFNVPKDVDVEVNVETN